MRGWASLLLLALLLVPPTQAILIGPALTLSDYPAQLSPPARGDGFTAWIDLRNGVPEVLLHRDKGDSVVRLVDHNGAALQHLVAWNRWLAWSQQDVAGILPGEQARRTNWDLIVYDVTRRAVVFDSASADRNETNPVMSTGRLAYLDDVTGVRQVMLAPLSGGAAFQGVVVNATRLRQGPPTLDGEILAFVQDGPDGDGIVRVRDGQATTLARATAGVGFGAPNAWGGRVGWPEHRGAQSSLAIWEDGVVTQRPWVNGTILQVAGDGDLAVAEAREQQKSVWAWCHGEAPTRLGPGIQSRPIVAHGAVAYLVQVGAEQHVQQRALSCGDTSAPSRGSPSPPGVLIFVVLIGLVAARR